MVEAVRAKVLLDSLNEKVEGLTEAVDKLAAAARQLSDDQVQEQKKIPAGPKPATLMAGQP